VGDHLGTGTNKQDKKTKADKFVDECTTEAKLGLEENTKGRALLPS
jgi:hypothetical protein